MFCFVRLKYYLSIIMQQETNKVALPLKVNKKIKAWVDKAAQAQLKKVSPFVEDILDKAMMADIQKQLTKRKNK